MTCRVAVITRTKNRPLLLKRAYESIRNQVFTDFQWVVVNDAGQVEPVQQIVEIATKAGINTLLINRGESIGMEAASNDGVKSSKSEYVVIHDDDDTWHENFLMETVRFLDERTEYLGVVTHSDRIDEKVSDNSVTKVNSRPYNNWLMSIQFSDLLVENPFPPISFLFRRSIWQQVGGFDELLPVLGDWDYHLKVLMAGDIGVLPITLANYHFRVQLKQDQQVYGNTVTHGVEKHIEFDAKYRNAKIRTDIKNNEFGLGYMLLLGRMNMQIFNKVALVTKVASRYKSLKKRLKL